MSDLFPKEELNLLHERMKARHAEGKSGIFGQGLEGDIRYLEDVLSRRPGLDLEERLLCKSLGKLLRAMHSIPESRHIIILTLKALNEVTAARAQQPT